MPLNSAALRTQPPLNGRAREQPNLAPLVRACRRLTAGDEVHACARPQSSVELSRQAFRLPVKNSRQIVAAARAILRGFFSVRTRQTSITTRATMTSRLHPDAFDSLAALSKFVDVQDCAQLFYARHKDGMDTVVRTIRLLMDGNPDLRKILGFTAAPVPVMASALRDWSKTAGVSNVEIEAIDRYVGIAVRAILPVFTDPKLPAFLRECRWGIVGAFAEDRKTA